MSNTHDATVFIQVEPDFWKWGIDPQVSAIRAVRMTQRRPRKQQAGTAMVKLTIRIPDSAFLPLRPEAVVEVSPDLVTIEPIEVTAGDPS